MQILRKALIEGKTFPHFARHTAEFMASTLFHTSDLYLQAKKKRTAVSSWEENSEMCGLTENVVFTDPFLTDASKTAFPNRHTSPHLDELVVSLRSDPDVILEVSALKDKFLRDKQALLHGDLHTGSVMVSSERTVFIDPEFAFYGPMGFDLGALLANLLIAFFAQDAIGAQEGGDRGHVKEWLLKTIVEVWSLFSSRFVSLWNEKSNTGDGHPRKLLNQIEGGLVSAQTGYLRAVFEDSLGFTACKMIRRVLGVAHVKDLECITEVEAKAKAEKKVLKMAVTLLKELRKEDGFRDIDEVTQFAQKVK
uniref:S-methyl-5-thioribose kinase n=1 Tax=Chromera velia CCMP2878 TaxID=1169474 RepID=A0A0G4HV99_9ALVE|eukprot:Cvel_8785.t1-p1 / transcript=Cvel_8785.t1 / gene=Cvel_8785 / organism=Chromera_velia_CCMP2878 / gene_product=Methylthioribose kinase, putative / transcript_product=Methylthioribose kinase, putative / location=Cvel_scaffold491:81537-82457(-) / protein_length=307 / sequence_SO=supercontig / SO=protein_coding / is_pseudo=false